MAFAKLLIYLLLSLSVSLSTANSIHGCGGFIEASSILVKSRRPSDRKLDYSHITVELQTVDGLVKDSTQCAPNGYYFIPVYDKGSFLVNVKGPDGWSWEPDMVPVTVDESGCNSNTDINFQFTGFMVSGKVVGAVGGNSCPVKDGGPSHVKVELLTMSDNVIVSALTSEVGHYSFANIIPGAYKLRASHLNLGVEIRGSSDVNLGFGNTVVDDIFFVSGYDLHGFVVSQGNPILGVHIYLYSDDVLEVYCPQGVGNTPSQKKALCHSMSNADGKFIFNSLPCGFSNKKVIPMEKYFKKKMKTLENSCVDNANQEIVPSSCVNKANIGESSTFTNSKRLREDFDVSEIISDPGLRPLISDFHVNIRDQVRRAYWLKGPCQPRNHQFKWTYFGKDPRRFIGDWFNLYGDWLEYSVSKDAAFCLCCYLFRIDHGEQSGGNIFATTGWSYWKKTSKLQKHVGAFDSAHNVALRKCQLLIDQKSHITVAFTKQSDSSKADYRTRLIASIDVVRFLLRQGLPFRGHDESETSTNKGNFLELLEWLADHNDNVSSVSLRNAPENLKLTSPQIQKEIVSVIACEIREKLILEIGEEPFSILIDESRDISIKEQMAIIFRYVDKKGCVIECFFAIIHVSDTTALSLKTALDMLFSTHGLSISRLRGQGYDGASNMQGIYNGLKSLILRENESAHYVHCFAHQLQLALIGVANNDCQIAMLFSLMTSISNIVGASCQRRDSLREKEVARITAGLSNGEICSGHGLNQETNIKRAGVYDLLPYYKGENTEFDVSPSSMTVTVEHHHVTISQKFQVTGFSIGGRVSDGNGDGVNGASIIVDGQQKATSDNDGFYKLDQVTSKHYTIMAKKDHYNFSTLENFLVLPSMASIDDIKATYYDVCGVVHMISRNTVAKVALTHGPESVKPQTKLTNENGSFCFLVPPGEYRLSVLAKNSNSSSSSLFAPSYIDTKVNTPLLDLEFFEAQVNIHGTVLCKEKCTPSVSVSVARLVGESEQERKMITLNNEGGDFIFPMIFPGKYLLMVKHASSASTDEDSWCWEQKSIYLDVGTRDVEGVVFVQKGYWISIISTHDTEAQIEQPDSSRIDLMIKKGSQRICIQNPGEHELHFRNSCVFFGGPSVKFDTKNLMPIYVTGIKYHLKGEIHIDASLLQDIQDQSGLIFIDIFNRDDALVDTVTARLVLIEGDPKGTPVFEYSFLSNLGQEVVFAPRYSSAIQGKMILFYPRKHHVSVTSDGCQTPVPIFVGRMGLYAEGSVSPSLAGVNIKVIAAGDSILSHLHTGDLVLVTETGADGSFSAGPLFDDIHYNVEALKPGYFVKQVGPYSFTCEKLGQIVVNVHDGGETVGLFPSVLLSLSGEDGYRNNSVSGAGGAFIFDNLFPGSFYLRPLLKEYSFSPAALAIELESGDSKEALFLAKRIAYSVLGTATLISGQPKEGVYVEARSESKGFYEEAITDGAGNFRLRGLLPDTTYRIKLATKEEPGLGSSRIERSSPDHLTVKVGTEDIMGVEFVVFEVPEMTILSGHVEGHDLETLQPHLSVEIRSASSPSEVESIIPLPFSYYFQIRDLAKGRHLVQLRPGLGWKSGRFESEVLDIDLAKQPQVHVGPLRYKVVEHHHKQELTPAPVFPLIIGVCVIVLFISLPRLKDLYHTAVERTPLGSSFAIPGKKEIRKQVLRKRAN